MISKFNTIYYRGAIDFCNYRCGYCPFSKTSFSKDTLEKDRKLLCSFIDQIRMSKDKTKDVFLLPYGESFHFPHVMKGLATLSSFDHVEHVAIQTNLSASVDTLVTTFKKEYGSSLSKLVLWCSFHPSQSSVDDFMLQCEKLIYYGIKFSVGSVAVPSNYKVLTEFRERLPDSVYFWLNAQDGKRDTYKLQEKLDFIWLDPFFTLELHKPLSDIKQCDGGRQSIYWNPDGWLSPCVASRTRCGKVGSEQTTTPTCTSKTCSCFLAYSQQQKGTLTDFFGKYKRLRIPASTKKKLLFFDIDGTLIDEHGQLPNKRLEILQSLQKTHLLFLNTALPRHHAYKKVGKLLPFFTGGSFNNGASIYFFQKNYRHIWELPRDVLNYFPKDSCAVYEDKKLCKIVSRNDKDGTPIVGLCSSQESDNCYTTHTYGGKEQACRFIARMYQKSNEDILHLGNSENDVLTTVPYYLVENSDDLVSYLSDFSTSVKLDQITP